MRERRVHLNLRVTESEKKAIARNARRCGLTASEFLRKLALGYVPKAVPTEEYRALNGTLLTLYAALQNGGGQDVAHRIARVIGQMEVEFLNPERRDFRGSDLTLGGKKQSG